MNYHQGTKAPRKEDKAPRKALDSVSELLATDIVDAALMVHRAIGPGVLESVYEACLAYELRQRGHTVETQVSIPIHYGDVQLDANLRADLWVDRLAIIELKAVESLLPVHEAQVISYLRLTGTRLGFLINFNVALIKNGIRRFVN